jgi:cytidylate kinase
MQELIIAIDGPVGSGKSTVARRVAELLGYTHLDSGAMYRALALAAMRKGIALGDAAALERLAQGTKIELVASAANEASKDKNLARRSQRTQRSAEKSRLEAGAPKARVLMDGEDVTAAIRSPEMSQAASRVAVHEGVRRPLVAQQQRAGAAGGVVMEGRDIGTVVFPRAELKIFLDASVEARAQRRLDEHAGRGEHRTLAQMIEEVRNRDRRDKERAVSPLRRADDAVYVDCTAMDAEETARLIALLAKERGQEPGKARVDRQ